MTREEIEKMPAGREMDALVAEKVFGWKWVFEPDALLVPPDTDPRVVWMAEWDDKGRPDWLECFSSNIADAWVIVEKLDCSFSLARAWLLDDTKWHGYSFWIGNGGEAVSSLGETAPLAICRAALLRELCTN